MPASTAEFFRVGNPLVLRSAARILTADYSDPLPTSLSSVIQTTAGSTQFDAKAPWTDLGVTKGGTRITRGSAEDTLDVNPTSGIISTQWAITGVEIETALADMSIDIFERAWGNPSVAVSASEVRVGGGPVVAAPLKRLALLHPIHETVIVTENAATRLREAITKIRGYIFPIVELVSFDTTISFGKTGEQQTLPVRFRATPDPAETDLRLRWFRIQELTL